MFYLRCSDDLLWRYADFVLDRDEVAGVQLFIQRGDHGNTEKEDKVVTFLNKYGKAELLYLEYLVVENNSQVCKKSRKCSITLEVVFQID
jgi:hypothetical protein